MRSPPRCKTSSGTSACNCASTRLVKAGARFSTGRAGWYSSTSWSAARYSSTLSQPNKSIDCKTCCWRWRTTCGASTGLMPGASATAASRAASAEVSAVAGLPKYTCAAASAP